MPDRRRHGRRAPRRALRGQGGGDEGRCGRASTMPSRGPRSRCGTPTPRTRSRSGSAAAPPSSPPRAASAASPPASRHEAEFAAAVVVAEMDGGDRWSTRSARSSRSTGGCRSTSTALAEDADLYEAGMTSHASVNVMLALEDAFDVEFPDRMLKRERLREHRRDRGGADRAASRGGRMSIAVDRDQAFLDAVSRDRRRGRGAERRRRRPRGALPARDDRRAARGAARCRRFVADRARRRRRLVRGARRAPASSSAAAAAPARWSSPCTRSRS